MLQYRDFIAQGPDGQKGEQKSVMFPGSTEGQCHPGQCYQQAEGGDPSPFLSLEVLSLIVDSPVQGKHEHTGQGPAKGHKYDEGPGACLL